MSQHRKGSLHGGNSVTNHGSSNNLHITSHEIQSHGIPLPGMVPTRSMLGGPILGNSIHGSVNPLGPVGPSHSPPSHPIGIIGMSHHPSTIYQGMGFRFSMAIIWLSRTNSTTISANRKTREFLPLLRYLMVRCSILRHNSIFHLNLEIFLDKRIRVFYWSFILLSVNLLIEMHNWKTNKHLQLLFFK